MNLIDALATKKDIRRPMARFVSSDGSPIWICSKYILRHLSAGDLRPWCQDDLLADDWEVNHEDVRIVPGLHIQAFTAREIEKLMRDIQEVISNDEFKIEGYSTCMSAQDYVVHSVIVSWVE